jgi:L-2-hydroxycarboxylate dehydrogenase (NAD+)
MVEVRIFAALWKHLAPRLELNLEDCDARMADLIAQLDICLEVNLKTETDEILYVPAEILLKFMEQVFVALGTPPEDARICAEALLVADLRGIESHGVGRLKVYYERIRAGVQLIETKIEIVRETGTSAVVDGHHGMGAVIASRSMRLAMDKARQHGLGAVAVRNSTHFGIAGYYALMAAQEGMMGLVMTNARSIIPPTFGAERQFGTNPIAFAAPSDADFHFCFDAHPPFLGARSRYWPVLKSRRPRVG